MTEMIALMGVCGTIVGICGTIIMGILSYWHNRDVLKHQFRQFVYGKQYDEYVEILRLTHKVTTQCRYPEKAAKVEADILEFHVRLSVWAGMTPRELTSALIAFSRAIMPFRDAAFPWTSQNYSFLLEAEMNVIERVRDQLGTDELSEEIRAMIRGHY